LPWWRLSILADGAGRVTSYGALRGWAGWIVVLLALAAMAAGLWIASGRRGRALPAALATGCGAGMAIACLPAALDPAGPLGLDLGPYASLPEVSASPTWAIALAALGSVAVVAGGLRIALAPRTVGREGAAGPPVPGPASAPPGADERRG
jgi:hypothetical protein